MKKRLTAGISILAVCFSSTALSVEAKSLQAHLTIKYALSNEAPSEIDREIVPDVDKLIKRPLKAFGIKLRKQYRIKVSKDIPDNKIHFINGIIRLEDIHTEYKKATDYFVTVRIRLRLITPEETEIFIKDYISTGQLKLGKQWAAWVGVNKAARFTFKKIFEKIARDKDLGKAIANIDHELFFKKETVSHEPPKTTKDPQKPEGKTIEQRFKALRSLKNQSLISEEEYQNKRRDLLDEL